MSVYCKENIVSHTNLILHMINRFLSPDTGIWKKKIFYYNISSLQELFCDLHILETISEQKASSCLVADDVLGADWVCVSLRVLGRISVARCKPHCRFEPVLVKKEKQGFLRTLRLQSKDLVTVRAFITKMLILMVSFSREQSEKAQHAVIARLVWIFVKVLPLESNAFSSKMVHDICFQCPDAYFLSIPK